MNGGLPSLKAITLLTIKVNLILTRVVFLKFSNFSGIQAYIAPPLIRAELFKDNLNLSILSAVNS